MTTANAVNAAPARPERKMSGVLGTKVGMTQVFDDANRIVPVTVVKAGPCVVTQVRTPSVDGYNAVQIAFGAIDPRTRAGDRLDDLARGGVDGLVVIGLQPDADLLSRHGRRSSFSSCRSLTDGPG